MLGDGLVSVFVDQMPFIFFPCLEVEEREGDIGRRGGIKRRNALGLKQSVRLHVERR